MMQLTYEEKFLVAGAIMATLDDKNLNIPQRQRDVLKRVKGRLFREMEDERIEFTDAVDATEISLIMEAQENE